MLQIKIVTIQDAELVSAISKQTFYEAFHAQNTKADMDLFLANNFNIPTTEDEIANAANTFYLAYKNHQLCAYAKVIAVDEAVELRGVNTLRISRIYVLNEFIGKGIGNSLIQQCLQKAIDIQAEVMWLGVWEKNIAAINFYKRYGFQQFGTENFVLGNDVQTDWLMKKLL